MKNLMLVLIVIFGLSLNLFAQEAKSPSSNGHLKGQVLDLSDTPISYASVSLFDDEAIFLQGTVTDEKGKFELGNVPIGNILLEIQYLGMETYRKSVEIEKRNQKVDLGIINMELSQQNLGEIEVVAEKSEYTIQLDKKVFNVGKDAITEGESALELLNVVPQVSVGPTGAISLRGNSNVQVLINGKRSGLTMNNALEQIPSYTIESVEVLTNPGANFEASGTAGIINIILKKNKNEGWSGQVTATAGIPAQHTFAPAMNYKNNKFNLFANARFRYSDYEGIYKTNQQTYNNGISNTLKMSENEDRHDDGRSAYIGGDYYFNDKNSLTVAYFRAETKDTDVTTLDYELTEENADKISILRTGNSEEKRNYNQIESNFTRKFDQKGKKLTMDFQYDFWNSSKDWILKTTGNDIPQNVETDLRTNTEMRSKDVVVKTDFTQPILENSSIQLGLKLENRIVENDYLAETLVDDNWSIYQDIDNNLDYSENIAAGYIQYKSKYNKVEYMVGVRSEYTIVDIKDVQEDFSSKNDYVKFFPSLHISMPIANDNKMQMSYSKRINRPSLWSIYPFWDIKDYNIQEIGNPNLIPSFSDAFEVSLSHAKDKYSVNPTIYFKNTKDPIQDFISRNETETFLIKPVNLENQIEAGLEINADYKLSKAIKLSGEFNYFYFDEKGTYQDINMDATGSTWEASFSASLRLPANIRFQTQFDYQAPQKTAQVEQLAVHVLTMSIGKGFFDNKLNVGIRAFNILDSYKRVRIISTETNQFEQSSRRNGTRLGLRLIYKINQSSRDRMRRENRGNR